uniref:Uncharacterized protein n=1 Tax=Rhizophora mucronata TaxID=61149 RepID=A0A2P2N8B7_RHIMU
MCWRWWGRWSWCLARSFQNPRRSVSSSLTGSFACTQEREKPEGFGGFSFA